MAKQFRNLDRPPGSADAIKVSRAEFVREIIPDESPDLSHIGAYSDKPGPADKTIDREERGDRQRGDYRYFIAAMSGAETGNPKSVEEDYRRMEEFSAGNVGMVGVRAKVELKIPNGQSYILQTIASPGLWGIESDSGEDYFAEVFAEESSTLVSMLEALKGIEIID